MSWGGRQRVEDDLQGSAGSTFERYSGSVPHVNHGCLLDQGVNLDVLQSTAAFLSSSRMSCEPDTRRLGASVLVRRSDEVPDNPSETMALASVDSWTVKLVQEPGFRAVITKMSELPMSKHRSMRLVLRDGDG